MATKGYTLIHSIVHGNVLGVVIAPKGTEDCPKGNRAFVWRTIMKPLVDEVAEHEELPAADIAKVAKELFEYCVHEGIGVSLNEARQL